MWFRAALRGSGMRALLAWCFAVPWHHWSGRAPAAGVHALVGACPASPTLSAALGTSAAALDAAFTATCLSTASAATAACTFCYDSLLSAPSQPDGGDPVGRRSE